MQQEKLKLKSNHLYGSYYQQQDQKYLKQHQTSRAYKTYIKGIKKEWNRNPNNLNTKLARDKMLYNSHKIT